jgi:hypothetical protein
MEIISEKSNLVLKHNNVMLILFYKDLKPLMETNQSSSHQENVFWLKCVKNESTRRILQAWKKKGLFEINMIEEALSTYEEEKN